MKIKIKAYLLNLSKVTIKPQAALSKTQPFKASLFADGKTNFAALSLVLRGAAEVLSQNGSTLES
jgi:hypothetical protein